MQEKPWDAGRLHIGENHRYLQNGNQPFFWLADTAWLLCQTTDEDQAKMYLTNRRDKGFTVIQSVLIHSLPNMQMSSLAAAERDATDPAYWVYVDKVVDLAEERGLYMALLPTWGSIVQSELLKSEDMDRYIRFLAARYGRRKNVIWLLGGDIRGDRYHDLYCRAGRLLKQLCPDTLIGYHPFGRTSSSLWFHGEEWLDFNMFQSGHRRYDQTSLGAWDDNRLDKETFFGEDNWRYVARDLAMDPPKPTVDGEPSYELILQGLHDRSQPYWREWDVRRYAYWSVFAGAMGHTYGDNSIQQMYANPLKPGGYGVRFPWWQACHHVGSGEMGILRTLMESVDYQHGAPAQQLLRSEQGEKYHRISLFAGKDFLMAYDYLGEAFAVDLTPWQGRTLHAWWMNPVSGCRSYFAELTGKTEAQVRPVARLTQDNDWVLLIRAE